MIIYCHQVYIYIYIHAIVTLVAYHNYITLLRVFHTSVNWYFLTGISVIASFLRSILVDFSNTIVHMVLTFPRACLRGVMVTAMDCGIVVSEFVLQTRYYVHFRERYEPYYPPSYGLNSTATVLLGGWLWH